MSSTLQQAKLFLALARRMEDPKALLSAREEAALAALAPQGTAPGFPEGAPGDARGRNALRRTNWFNGRFLTAEALRRQDNYFDLRARLGAHTLMPGVAHGLGLSASGLNAMPVQGERVPPSTGGFGKAEKITLSPGLAFDHVGRPILVSQPFDFTLEQLIAIQRKTPRRVAPGGVEFAPCICLVPEPEGPTGGAPAVRPGPYLLVIEPGEIGEGEARVHGEACAGPQPTTCQSESWRGAFGLSLVRVPLELPVEGGLDTAWALRGTASAWWFDVFEHSLIRRWDPAFAGDDGFRQPAGPGRHEAGAIALAMVWLGTDGSAIFLDPWIPRRSITATPAEDWHRTRFGAPPRAAAWARIHQFQTMLAESLAVSPLRADAPGFRPNLFRRGFRHIPPIGFLPLDPALAHEPGGQGLSTGHAMLDRIIASGSGQVGLISGLVAAARRQAFSYFEGTNVVPYCVVALHDDDILEDLANVFDKDPVRLALRAPRQVVDVQADIRREPVGAFLAAVASILEVLGLDELVNRRTEVVKVVIPMQGLVRPHPVLGVVPEDARAQAADWLGSQPPAGWGLAATLYDARGMAGLAQRLPLEMLPRHFAVYVRQRLVLLDLLVMLIELLQVAVLLARDMSLAAKAEVPGATLSSTAAYRRAWMRQPAEKRALAEAALAEPMVRDALLRAAALTTPDLSAGPRLDRFVERLAATEAALAAEIPDAAERERVALERVSDAYAAEHPGFAVMQILSAVQPPAQAKEMLATLRRRATLGEATLADRLATEAPVEFDAPAATLAYAAMREALSGKPARDFLAEAPEGLTAAELLTKPQEEAERLIGGKQRLQGFLRAVTKERTALAEAARALAAPPPPAAVERVTEAITGGGDAMEALERARAASGDAAVKTYLSGAATMLRTLGPERTLALARLRPPG